MTTYLGWVVACTTLYANARQIVINWIGFYKRFGFNVLKYFAGVVDDPIAWIFGNATFLFNFCQFCVHLKRIVRYIKRKSQNRESYIKDAWSLVALVLVPVALLFSKKLSQAYTVISLANLISIIFDNNDDEYACIPPVPFVSGGELNPAEEQKAVSAQLGPVVGLAAAAARRVASGLAHAGLGADVEEKEDGPEINRFSACDYDENGNKVFRNNDDKEDVLASAAEQHDYKTANPDSKIDPNFVNQADPTEGNADGLLNGELKEHIKGLRAMITSMMDRLSTRRRRAIATIFIICVVVLVFRLLWPDIKAAEALVEEAKRKRRAKKRKGVGQFYLNGFGDVPSGEIEFTVGSNKKRINFNRAGCWKLLSKFADLYGQEGVIRWALGDKSGTVQAPDNDDEDGDKTLRDSESKEKVVLVKPPLKHESAAPNVVITKPKVYTVTNKFINSSQTCKGTLVQGKIITVAHVFDRIGDVTLTDELGNNTVVKVGAIHRASEFKLDYDLASIEVDSPPTSDLRLVKVDPIPGTPVAIFFGGERMSCGKITHVTENNIAYDMTTVMGDCGSAIVSSERDAFGIVAIHVAGGNGTSNFGVPASHVKKFLDSLNSSRRPGPSGSRGAAATK